MYKLTNRRAFQWRLSTLLAIVTVTCALLAVWKNIPIIIDLVNQPENAYQFRARGARWVRRGNLERAVSDFSEAIRREPRFASVYEYRATTYLLMGKLKKATNDCRNALRHGLEDTDSVLNCAVIFLKADQPAKAMSLCEWVLAREPDNSRAWEIRGAVHRYFGENKEAIAASSRVIEINPNAPTARRNRRNAIESARNAERAAAAPKTSKQSKNGYPTIDYSGGVKGAGFVELWRVRKKE